jgi:hypothetical protein
MRIGFDAMRDRAGRRPANHTGVVLALALAIACGCHRPGDSAPAASDAAPKVGLEAAVPDAGQAATRPACPPKDAPPRSYCEDAPAELTGKLVEQKATLLDGIAAHGKVPHLVWILELDAKIRVYAEGAPLDVERVQLNAQVASEKRWNPALVGRRVVAKGALSRATRPHEIQDVVMWGDSGPPVVTATKD